MIFSTVGAFKEPIMSTKTRVPDHTSPDVNEQIRKETKVSLEYYAAHSNKIDRPRLIDV